MSSPSSLMASGVMAIGLCFHFFGYEMARAASIALLSAKEIGLGAGALPSTVFIGSPASAFVLYLYAKSIKKNGARFTLLVSNIGCLSLLGLMWMFCRSLKGHWGQAAVIVFYCFREIYVSLISTQQWSFIASTLDSKTSSYLVKFSGVVSVASAVGGCAVEHLVSFGGVRGLLFTAFLACVCSFLCAETANVIVVANPPPKVDKAPEPTTASTAATATTSDSKPPQKKSPGIWRNWFRLLMKHETLQLLFVEALIHQACSNMLNMMFHDGLRFGVPLESERAVLVGRFFASVNIAACLLQVFVLPSVLSHSTLPQVLASIPVIVLIIVIGGFIFPSLLAVMLGFGTLKVLEYAIMTSATEMIYMPMSQEHRYLGKEMIRFFGHRMGKSAATLILSAASEYFRPSMAVQSLWGVTITVGWCGVMYTLASHLSNRDAHTHKHTHGHQQEEDSAGISITSATTGKATGTGKAISASEQDLATAPSEDHSDTTHEDDDDDCSDTSSAYGSTNQFVPASGDQTLAAGAAAAGHATTVRRKNNHNRSDGNAAAAVDAGGAQQQQDQGGLVLGEDCLVNLSDDEDDHLLDHGDDENESDNSPDAPIFVSEMGLRQRKSLFSMQEGDQVLSRKSAKLNTASAPSSSSSAHNRNRTNRGGAGNSNSTSANKKSVSALRSPREGGGGGGRQHSQHHRSSHGGVKADSAGRPLMMLRVGSTCMSMTNLVRDIDTRSSIKGEE